MGPAAEDWNTILQRLLAGDRVAFLHFNRLVTGFLVQLRAYDFEEEWEDLRQEVLVAVVASARAGRLRDRQALVGYVRIITRNKFMDRLKRRIKWSEKETLPWEEEMARVAALPAVGSGPSAEDRNDLWRALGELPEEQRRPIERVYVEGQTYQEESAASGVPLGTLKRMQTQGLKNLRKLMGIGGPG